MSGVDAVADVSHDPALHYDRVVSAWGYMMGEDLHYGYFTDPEQTLTQATDALTDQMVGLAQPYAGDRVIDIGCGTGKAACRMAVENQASVLGVSPSDACIRDANARANSLADPIRPQFIPGDGTSLCFSDHSFDCAWVMESSHLMSDKSALLQEVGRVLAPAGRIVLCDIMLERKLELREVIRYRDEFLLLKDVFGRAIMEPLNFYTEQLESLGFSVEGARDISAETQMTFCRWEENAREHRRSVTELIGKQGWQQFVDACEVLERFWSDNILGYGILCARLPA